MKDPIQADSTRDRLKILCVNAKEEDTRFLTKNVAVDLIHADDVNNAADKLKEERIDGVLVDVGAVSPQDLSRLQNTSEKAKCLPWLTLAGLAEVPQAIEHIRHGSRGFLVKGISTASSVLPLFDYARKGAES